MAIKQRYEIPDPDGNGVLRFEHEDTEGIVAQAFSAGRKRGGKEAAQRVQAKLAAVGIDIPVNTYHEVLTAALAEEVQRGS